jgi:Carboxypeptidase regulatory-like domain
LPNRQAPNCSRGVAHAGAEVTPSDPSTGFSRTTNTGADGVYNFPDLPLGAFKIRVTHAGFKASERVGIVVRASDSLVFNLALAVGAVSEQITVEASAIQEEEGFEPRDPFESNLCVPIEQVALMCARGSNREVS